MKLKSAQRHLKRRHYDCWSCRVELIMVNMMAENQRVIVRDGVVKNALTGEPILWREWDVAENV